MILISYAFCLRKHLRAKCCLEISLASLPQQFLNFSSVEFEWKFNKFRLGELLLQASESISTFLIYYRLFLINFCAWKLDHILILQLRQKIIIMKIKIKFKQFIVWSNFSNVSVKANKFKANLIWTWSQERNSILDAFKLRRLTFKHLAVCLYV